MEIPGQNREDGMQQAEYDFFRGIDDVYTTVYALFLAHTMGYSITKLPRHDHGSARGSSRDSALLRVPLVQLPHRHSPAAHPLPPHPSKPTYGTCQLGDLFTQITQRHPSSMFLSHKVESGMLRRVLPVIWPMATYVMRTGYRQICNNKHQKGRMTRVRENTEAADVAAS
ncbi:hypothetical protein DFH29DRAFT_899090 [Suillus ampliporus]|nr:hypothetical protein DFH29DRAFT_899090 [Suillus ampliporus]